MLLSDYSHVTLILHLIYSGVTLWLLPRYPKLLHYSLDTPVLPLTCFDVTLWILLLLLFHSRFAFWLLTYYSLDTPVLFLSHSCVALWLLPHYSSLPHCSLFTPLLLLVTPTLLLSYAHVTLGIPILILVH